MMEIGGVIIGAGTVLEIQQGDYLIGAGTVRLFIEQIVDVYDDWDGQWIMVIGKQKLPEGPWSDRRLKVRVSALKRSMQTLAA